MSSLGRSTAGRVLLTIVEIVQIVGTLKADYNETHIFNPLWLGHAKFHTGQTISLSVFLGLTSVWKAWFPAHGEGPFTAYWLASAYFLTQITAWCFPGVTGWDAPQHYGYAFPQAFIFTPLLALLAVAYVLEMRAGAAAGASTQDKVKGRKTA